MPKKILIILDSAQNSIYMQSIAYAFKKNNYDVEFLFLCEKGELSEKLNQHQIKTHHFYLNGSLLKKTIKGINILRKIQKEHQYDFIFSHLTLPNLITAISQKFIFKAKLVVCRHHTDMYYLENIKNGIRLDKFIQKMARNIVVISEKSKEVMVNLDKTPVSKITFLPLLYDFSLYDIPLSKSNNEKIQIIFVSRIVPLKNIQKIIPALIRIKKENQNQLPFSIVVVGDGPYLNDLELEVAQNGLLGDFNFKGHLPNPMIEISKADVLVLLSSSESSNQVVKEAGIAGKPVIACQDVGDFDTYLNTKNAFLLPKEFNNEDVYTCLNSIINKTEVLNERGLALKNSVFETFELNEQNFRSYLNYFS